MGLTSWVALLRMDAHIELTQRIRETCSTDEGRSTRAARSTRTSTLSRSISSALANNPSRLTAWLFVTAAKGS